MKRRVPEKKLVRTAEWPYAKAVPAKGFNYEEAEKAQVKTKPTSMAILRIMKTRSADLEPGRFYYNIDDRVFIGTKRNLRWLAGLLHERAKLPGRRMELKMIKGGVIIDIYEFPPF